MLSRTVQSFSRLMGKRVPTTETKRHLHLHEYQSQALMQKYGINVPQGSVASSPSDAKIIAQALGTEDIVVKAQILAGGRGKGVFSNGFQGGVHIVTSPEEARTVAEKMLGKTLITKQTGPSGKVVSKVLICKRHYIRKETYLAILLDRQYQGPVIVASPYGGMDIETVAHDNPNSIFKQPIDFLKGPSQTDSERIAGAIGLGASKMMGFHDQLTRMYKLFRERDALMLEINPFVELADGSLMCMDAKLNFDDNAKFRQAELFGMEDKSQMDSRELAAAEHDLNYIGLDGNIGCLVNGAGLAMATLDLIKLYGGSPANFLDIGGGASKNQVLEAFRILSNDPNVRCILVNIFGGIMRCDVIAMGLIAATQELALKIPVVLRLQGTNVEQAKDLIESSGLRIMMLDDLDMAAKKSVKVSKIMELARDAQLDVSFQIPD